MVVLKPKSLHSAAIVERRLEKGPATNEVDDMEPCRFLYIALTDKEIEAKGIGDLFHTVKDGESKPKMTDQEITGGD